MNTIKRQLKYNNISFPGLEWKEFLKNCEVDFYSSRKDKLWFSIRGKGYRIWISRFYVQKENDTTYWLSDIEIEKNAPPRGKEAFDELIQASVARFEKMELVI